MSKNELIQLFGEQKVRTKWDDEKQAYSWLLLCLLMSILAVWLEREKRESDARQAVVFEIERKIGFPFAFLLFIRNFAAKQDKTERRCLQQNEYSRFSRN